MRGQSVYLPSALSHYPCAEKDIGKWRFHSLLNALAVARGHNRKAGEKVYCVVVRRGHFEVVLAD